MGLGLPLSVWEPLLAVVVVPVSITTFNILALETDSELLLLTPFWKHLLGVVVLADGNTTFDCIVFEPGFNLDLDFLIVATRFGVLVASK